MMMKVAALGLDEMFLNFLISLKQEFGGGEFGILQAIEMRNCHPFLSKFKELWAINGDYLSLFYAGSTAVTSRMTKTGNAGFTHKIDSALISL